MIVSDFLKDSTLKWHKKVPKKPCGTRHTKRSWEKIHQIFFSMKIMKNYYLKLLIFNKK